MLNTIFTTSGARRSGSAGGRRASRWGRLPPAVRWGGAGLLVLALGGLGLLAWARTPAGQAALLALGVESRYEAVQQNVQRTLLVILPDLEQEVGLAGVWPLDEAAGGRAVRCRVVRADSSLSFWETQLRLAEGLREVGARVLWSERLPRTGRSARGLSGEAADLLRLDLGVGARPTHTLLLYRQGSPPPQPSWDEGPRQTAWTRLAGQPAAPTVALVIDDWGYFDNEVTEGLLQMDVPLTMAVLPGLPYSRRFALAATPLATPDEDGASGSTAGRSAVEGARHLRRQRLAHGCVVEFSLAAAPADLPSRRREVWLHLPMQPQAYPEVDPGSYAILTGMDSRQIEQTLDRALAGLPGVRGVNNHMGSSATTDAATMQRLMKALAERDLLFLDSLTASASVAAREAGEAGLPVLRNRIFLDQTEPSRPQVERLLGRLVEAARGSGFAVGIGHPYPETLAVLQREVPRLQASGVRFVTLSELLFLRDGEPAGAD